LMVSAWPESKTSLSAELALSPGEYLRIRIADDGIGMDETTLAKATEPFFTTKGLGKGTGLGLSMVHVLAAQSGGLLRISSELNKGTTVDLWLPAAKSDAVSLPRGDRGSQIPETRSCKVLLVDDDPLVITGTAALIEDLGHTSIEAHSGVEALAKLASGIEVDVVITDHAMPVMTGLQLLEGIKERYPELPVILATGYAELPAEPSTLGVCKLTKPCSQQDIALAIHTALCRTPAGGSVVEAGRAKWVEHQAYLAHRAANDK